MPRKITKKAIGVYEKDPGSGIWWIRFKVNGVSRREKIGRRGDAIAAYRDRKTAILRGEKLPATLKNRGIKFSEIGQAAIDWYKRTGKKDLRTFEGRMRILMASPLGGKPANDIDHEMIERWINEHDGWSPATCNRYKTTISRAYSLALKSKKVMHNPARLVDNWREDNERVRWLTHGEEKRLRAVIKKRCPDQLPALTVALHTGMRKGEQFGLTWAGVDLDRSQLTLRKTKNGKTRYVQLNRTALAAFRAIERSETNGYVFQATRYDARLQDPKKWFENAIEEARIEDFRWHDLRHTFISRLVMAGVPLAIVQKLAGHGDPKMTSRYAHLAPKVTQDAVNTLDAAIAVDPAEAAAIQSLDHSAVS
jgi:integrase